MNNSQTIFGNNWQAIKFQDSYVLNINFDANIIATLEDFVHQEKIQSAEITGIGAVNYVQLGFYNYKTKVFDEREFHEQMELTSAMGNIAFKDEELYIHLHGTFGKKDFSTIAGHMIEARIHGVGEFYIRTNPKRIIKSKDAEKNMWVYDFEK